MSKKPIFLISIIGLGLMFAFQNCGGGSSGSSSSQSPVTIQNIINTPPVTTCEVNATPNSGYFCREFYYSTDCATIGMTQITGHCIPNEGDGACYYSTPDKEYVYYAHPDSFSAGHILGKQKCITNEINMAGTVTKWYEYGSSGWVQILQ